MHQLASVRTSAVCGLIFLISRAVLGAGVTIITHGFNGNVTDWIIPMAEKIPEYYKFPGNTNFSCYEVYFVEGTPGVYEPTQARIGGINPTNSPSAEILVKLDWSPLSVSLATSTTDIAASVAPLILSPTFIPELGGKSLAEFPLHLVGHSRGGSVVSEMARLLGSQGVWVDQVTTLDPHPVSLYGDAEVFTYLNVLFADNYWQSNPDLLCPNGESVFGAYNRYLDNLSGGYDCPHSDTHLWYHGTIDFTVPTSDTDSLITAAERQNWWSAYEAGGTNAGFYYTLLGGGDRLSAVEPAGAGMGRIVDGYNQAWDLGAGISGNRTALPSNDGSWPNIIKLNVAGTNVVTAGQTTTLKYVYQFGQSSSQSADLRFFIDSDLNPWNTNATQFFQASVPGSGTNSLRIGTVDFTPDPATSAPGLYAIYGTITFGGHTRILYAPEIVQLKPSLEPPRSRQPSWLDNHFQFTVSGFPGQKLAVQISPDFRDWTSISTNTLSGFDWIFSDLETAGHPHRFYRVVLLP